MHSEFLKNSILNKFSPEVVSLASESRVTLFYSVDKSVIVARSSKEHYFFDSQDGRFIGARPNSEFNHSLFNLISLTEVLTYKRCMPLSYFAKKNRKAV